MPDKTRVLRAGVLCGTFFLVYLLLNRPEVIFISGLGFTAWYPAAGLSMAAMLGLSPWFGLVVLITDPVVGRLIYNVPVFSWPGLLGACGPAGFYALAAYVLRGPWKVDVSLRQRRDVLRYFGVAVVAAAGSTSIGVSALVMGHSLESSRYWQSWISWYGGEIIGVVGVAPFLLAHVLPAVRRFLARGFRRRAEATPLTSSEDAPLELTSTLELTAQMISIPAAQYIILRYGGGHPLFLLFIPILWIAMRQGVRRVVTGNVVLILGVVIGLRLYPVPSTSLFSISLTLLFMTTTGLIVGSMVTEQFRQARELRDRTVYLHSLVKNLPLATIFMDLDRRMEFCNDAFVNVFQYSREDLAAATVDNLIWLPEMSTEVAQRFAEVVAGRPHYATTQRRRKDGTVLDVELIAVPLLVDGKPRGVCSIYTDISERLRTAEESRRHAEQLDGMVRELQVHNTEMTLLTELNSLLQCCANLQEAYTAVAQAARKLFPAATAGKLFVFRPEQKILESVAHWGEPAATESGFEPLACWGFRRGQAHWSDYPGGGVICQHLKNPVESSYLCVPMMAGNQTAGVLHLQVDRGERERGTPEFESLMDGMKRLAVTAAGQIALAMVSLRLREELENRSIRDPLTGLYNRRMLEAGLNREIQRAKRKDHSVSVVFIDLDHFKNFNDNFGHAAGDAVLVTMGKMLQGFFRGEDVVCRYGGEEFAVVMPEAKTGDAAARAEQLRAKAEQLTIRFQERELDRVTLSIGVATFPEHASTPEDLLRAADQCLYRSKSAGRNRVTVAESPIDLPPAPVPAEKQLT